MIFLPGAGYSVTPAEPREFEVGIFLSPPLLKKIGQMIKDFFC